MNKYLLGLIVLVILFVGFLFRGNDKPAEQGKPSSVLFMEKVFSVKTCNEFVSFFDGEAKTEIEKDNKNNFTTVEDCNKNLVDHFNNNSIQCREFDKNALNFDFIDFGVLKNRPLYSDAVLCSKKSEKDAYFFLEYNKQDGIYKIKAMGGDIKEEVEAARKAEETKNQEVEARKNTTNPGYLQLPAGSFVLDLENEISDLPDDNKSVWVEEVQDENTIIVSYFILKGSESFLTFATVDLYGLSDLGGCHKTESVKFLKQFIEHKYVYLSGGNKDSIQKKFLLKRVSIWKEDIDVQVALIDRLYNDEQSKDEIEINYAMVRLGYASPCTLYALCRRSENISHDITLQRSLESEQEVAKVAKRGFWETCE